MHNCTSHLYMYIHAHISLSLSLLMHSGWNTLHKASQHADTMPLYQQIITRLNKICTMQNSVGHSASNKMLKSGSRKLMPMKQKSDKWNNWIGKKCKLRMKVNRVKREREGEREGEGGRERDWEREGVGGGGSCDQTTEIQLSIGQLPSS